MKRKDIFILVGIGVIAAIISAITAGAIFSSSSTRSVKVPVVSPISSDFPDIAHDSQYKAIFNDKALDPTQLIKIGTGQNQQPFNNSQ